VAAKRTRTARLRLEGLEDLEAAFRQLDEVTRGDVLSGAVLKSMEPIRADAAARAPQLKRFDRRRTPGLLAREIVVKLGEVTTRTAEAVVGPTKKAWYAHFVELGTSRMAAIPFLRPAYSAKRKEAQAIFAAEMRRRIEGVARG
jgi:HK97 gp10 family phage protein